MRWSFLALFLLSICTFLLSSCGDDGGSSSDSSDGDLVADGDDETGTEEDGDTEDDTEPARVSENYKVRGSIEQIYIWLAEPGITMEVVSSQDEVIASGETDDLGSLVFRTLPSAEDYRVRPADDPDDYTDQIHVMSIEGSQPDEDFYASQTLQPGYGYLTARDGTTLSIFVSLPGPVEDGPYPTVVNYSGYSPSRPGQSLGETAELFCDDYPILCDAPSAPSALIAGVMGYASVSVNLRGTGCSGGAYDYFEPMQILDGYDVIEIVARQSWVKHHKVGMVGLSYPGITQLFVASSNPPSLAAIAPFSVIADTVTSTLVPGGIYNNGFALEWIQMVLDKASPYAHQWIVDLVDAGDTICEENQLLHGQKLDAIAKALENPYYTDEVAKPLDPTTFVQKINVPVFMTGQTQDEQTGPHFPALFDKFTQSPVTRFTVTNGIHMDGFAPQILGEWANFLSFYVNREIPGIDSTVRGIVPLFMVDVYGAQGLSLPPERFTEYTDFEQAKADYEAEDAIRVIFETGAKEGITPGGPEGVFEAGFSEWPIPELVPTRYYFQPGGAMSLTAPDATESASWFTPDPEAGDRITLNSGSVETPQPDYIYRDLVSGKAVSFLSEALEDDLFLIGPGSVDLWIQSTADDADLEVQLSDVRPDGKESFIQNGWLRASHRTLLPESTDLRPVSSHYEEDVSPLPADDWTLVRVELMAINHIVRAGSRLRLSIDTPGDSCARWRFLLLETDDDTRHYIAHDSTHPSSMVLPVVPDLVTEGERPDCTALRGQPCRDYLDFVNNEALP